MVWVHGEAKVVRDREGRPLFLQGVAFDITRLKEAEAELTALNQTLDERVTARTAEAEDRARELARSNADLDAFAYAASHDLREPLRAVNFFLDRLKKKLDAQRDDSCKDEIGCIADSTRLAQEWTAELERRVKELARSNDDLDAFACDASHDLTAPLRAVNIYLDELKTKLAGQLDDSCTDYIGPITENICWQDRLIQDLFDYARVGREEAPAAADCNRLLVRAQAAFARGHPGEPGRGDGRPLAHGEGGGDGAGAAVPEPDPQRHQVSRCAAGSGPRQRRTPGGGVAVPRARHRHRHGAQAAGTTVPKDRPGGPLARSRGVSGHGLRTRHSARRSSNGTAGASGAESQPGCGSTFWFTLP